MVNPQSLLDHQHNPTETLQSFSNAVFNSLDMQYEPKGSQLLEPEKMKALLSFLTPQPLIATSVQISTLVFNALFLAFRVETIFTALGPSVTQGGLLTYLRSEIMSDPEGAFTSFQKANQIMRLGPPFVRSQFPAVPEPRAKELAAHLQASIAKTIKNMSWSAASAEKQLAVLKARHALEERGRQNALDLIGSSVCYRVLI
ncbi:hypothetical protein EMPS_08504 [Entomortierella parvispora]|uniref:DUF7514 domain-containing protein n=1 Tax=Entomortierella parvispora TaxID=205924 RepID=A0A9P3HGH3_9FUNG|nr:hypothetical protein EMPS_08504 [Entomortierella parvispora]